MIEIEQRYDFDCVQACLASIFELPYEFTPVIWEPGSDTHRADWLFILNNWLRERGFALQNFHRREADSPQKSPWHFVGYWIGGVWSPRFTEPDGSPGAHAVVMKGSTLIWDPNPRRDMGHLGFYCADVLMPLDPARFDVAAFRRSIESAGAHKVYAVELDVERQERVRVEGLSDDLDELAALDLWLEAQEVNGDRAAVLRDRATRYIEAVRS